MQPKPDTEDVKRLIAGALFESGFGQDALRNWYMACHMLDHPSFKGLCKWAYDFQFYGSSSSSMMNAMKRLVNDIAQMVYEVSLQVPEPSPNPDINWRAAEFLIYPLRQAFFLFDDLQPPEEPNQVIKSASAKARIKR